MRTRQDIAEKFEKSLKPYSPDGSGVKSDSPLGALVSSTADEIATANMAIKDLNERFDKLILGKDKDLAKSVADILWEKLQKKNDIEKGEFIDSLRGI